MVSRLMRFSLFLSNGMGRGFKYDLWLLWCSQRLTIVLDGGSQWVEGLPSLRLVYLLGKYAGDAVSIKVYLLKSICTKNSALPQLINRYIYSFYLPVVITATRIWRSEHDSLLKSLSTNSKYSYMAYDFATQRAASPTPFRKRQDYVYVKREY